MTTATATPDLAFTDEGGADLGWTICGWTPALQTKPLPPGVSPMDPLLTRLEDEAYTTPDLDVQAQTGATGVLWEGPEPTEADLRAGVYQRARVTFQGIPVVIENPRGSIRSGVNPQGRRWAVTMVHHYGFIARTFGADGDAVDCFIGPDHESQEVYVVDQIDPATGEFDEAKVMLGWTSEEEAREAYLANYSRGWKGLGKVWSCSIEDFKDWLTWDDTTRPVAKAGFAEADSDGGRWITVHPGGGEGHPIKVMPVKGTKGVYRVVGGAGGKLNGLRLHGLKDPAQYQAEARDRAKDRRTEAREERAKMSPEERAAATQGKAKERQARKEAEKKFIRDTLGPQAEEQPQILGEDGQPVAAEDQDPQEKHREMLAKAHAAVKAAEKKILLDAEARATAGAGVVGGDTGLDIEDLVDEAAPKGPGYRRELGKRAEAAGLSADKLMEAVADIKARRDTPEGGSTAAAVEGAENKPANVEAHKATKELQAHKAAALREAAKEAVKQNEKLADLVKARAELRKAYKESAPKARVFEEGFQAQVDLDQPTEAIEQSIYEQMLSGHVSSFLREVGEVYPEGEGTPDLNNPREMDGLHAVRGAGAFDCLHEISLAAVGQGMLERDTVEALGPEGAAQVLARGLRQQFTPEDQASILEALEAHHLKEQEALPGIVEEARNLRAEANRIQMELAANPRDLQTAVAMQKNRLAALKDARRSLGAALGRLEARAAVIASMRGKDKDTLTLPMGVMTPERAVQSAAALGLQDGDYLIDHEHGEAVIHLAGAGQDRLLTPVDAAAAAEREVALAIKSGQMDQEGWLPAGFANRARTRYDHPVQEPMELRNRLKVPEGSSPEDIRSRIEDHVGLRVADGERPGDILADLFSATALEQVPPGHQADYLAQVQAVFPLQEVVRDEKGEPVWEVDQDGNQIKDTRGNLVPKTKMRPADSLLPQFQAMAEKALAAKGMGPDAALHGQIVDMDHPDFHEAIHRALAEDPRLRAAYIPSAELTHEQGAGIRDFFYREVAKKEPGTPKGKQGELQAALEAAGPEPPKFEEGGGLFELMDADPVESPTWTQWRDRRQAAMDQHAAGSSTPWADYVQSMGGLGPAQQAVQDAMRSRLNEGFSSHYQRLTGKGLRMGKAGLSHAETYLQATGTPEEQEALRKRKQGEIDSLRQRSSTGKYAQGTVVDKLEEARKQKAAAAQAQSSLFGDDFADEAPAEDAEEAPRPAAKPTLAGGERFSLGTALEGQLRSAMPGHAANFEGVNRKVKVAEGVRMDGEYITQQRAVKAITNLKRQGLFLGAGSGKTPIMLGSLTQLHHDGKVRKSILAVPSIVQGQFGAEALNFIDSKSGFQVHAKPGEDFEGRMAAYRDPGKHAVVVTHQTLRDDTLKILGQHRGTDDAATHAWVMSAPKAELAKAVKDAFSAAGIDSQALMVDEAHGALDRLGKEDSTWSRILDAHSRNHEYVVMATGDPLKNDTSEIWSNLNKLDPHRYPDESRDEFMRRFGGDAELARKSLSQQLTRYWFNGRVKLPTQAYKTEDQIPLAEGQQARIKDIDLAAGKLRTTDEDAVKWARTLAPAAFEGHPEEEHEAIAKEVQRSIGTFREAALNRAINLDPAGGKIQHLVGKVKEGLAEGKPRVIFAKNLEAVDAIHRALEQAGVKVTSLTGRDSSTVKGEKVRAFQPPGWDHPDPAKRVKPQADVIVLSDAGATGVNLQRGKQLTHYDLPMTAMTWKQRDARINRIGQTDDVEIDTLMADHPWEKANLDRVKRKESLGAIFQSPEGYLDDEGLAGDLRAIRARKNQAVAA